MKAVFYALPGKRGLMKVEKGWREVVALGLVFMLASRGKHKTPNAVMLKVSTPPPTSRLKTIKFKTSQRSLLMAKITTPHSSIFMYRCC